MRRKLLTISLATATLYSVGRFIHSFGRALDLRVTRNAADKAYQDANHAWNMANDDYQSKLNVVHEAQQNAADLSCATNGYEMFNNELREFCSASNDDVDVLATLGISYGISMQRALDDIESTIRSFEDPSCTKTTSGRDCTVRVYQTTYRINGVMLDGPGSSSLLNCGSYTRGLQIATQRFPKKIEQWIGDDRTHEHRTITYASMMQVDLYADKKTPVFSARAELDPNSSDFKANAINMLETIGSQCRVLNRSLKPISYYQMMSNNTNLFLSHSNIALNQSLAALTPVTIIRDAKAKIAAEAQSDLESEAALVVLSMMCFIGFGSCTLTSAQGSLIRIDNGNPNPNAPEPTAHGLEEDPPNTEPNAPNLLVTYPRYAQIHPATSDNATELSLLDPDIENNPQPSRIHNQSVAMTPG